MTLIARIQALILAWVKMAAFLLTMLAVGGFALPAATAEAQCSDCDLVLAERDLPDGYAYDADSPERDPKGQARSIQIDNCVVATKLRREPPGTEGQFALFVTTH